jgi:hypothetical protein
LPEEPIFTLNLLKLFITEPAFLISFVIVILTFVLTSILISAPTSLPTFMLTFIILIASALALAELTLSLISEIAALSPATYIPAKPQVQSQTLLILCRNCQATFILRNRLYKHL